MSCYWDVSLRPYVLGGGSSEFSGLMQGHELSVCLGSCSSFFWRNLGLTLHVFYLDGFVSISHNVGCNMTQPSLQINGYQSVNTGTPQFVNAHLVVWVGCLLGWWFGIPTCPGAKLLSIRFHSRAAYIITLWEEIVS